MLINGFALQAVAAAVADCLFIDIQQFLLSMSQQTTVELALVVIALEHQAQALPALVVFTMTTLRNQNTLANHNQGAVAVVRRAATMAVQVAMEAFLILARMARAVAVAAICAFTKTNQ